MERTPTSSGAYYGIIPAARLHRTSWAAVSVDSSSTGTVHARAHLQSVVTRASNSHDSVGTSVRVLSRLVERLVTAVVATFLV